MQLSNVFNENILNDGVFEVLGILDSITDKKILTFIEQEKYINKIEQQKNIGCIITTKELAYQYFVNSKLGIYICENPRLVFFKLHNQLSEDQRYVRSRFKTKIGSNCKISSLAFIDENNVIIGDNVIIEEFVSIKANTIINDDCIIRSGTVIGGTGFEFKKENNVTFGVKHCGGVILEANVEVQHNSCIDRAVYPWDNTIIGEYSKVDNHVHIGHAVKIGKRVLLPALSVIGGRTEIEDDAWIGIGSVIRNGIHIGKNARSNMGAVVTRDIDDNKSVSGNYAIDHKKFISIMRKVGKEDE